MPQSQKSSRNRYLTALALILFGGAAIASSPPDEEDNAFFAPLPPPPVVKMDEKTKLVQHHMTLHMTGDAVAAMPDPPSGTVSITANMTSAGATGTCPRVQVKLIPDIGKEPENPLAVDPENDSATATWSFSLSSLCQSGHVCSIGFAVVFELSPSCPARPLEIGWSASASMKAASSDPVDTSGVDLKLDY